MEMHGLSKDCVAYVWRTSKNNYQIYVYGTEGWIVKRSMKDVLAFMNENKITGFAYSDYPYKERK